MNAQHRRKRVDPRKVVDNVGIAVRAAMGEPPSDNFVETLNKHESRRTTRMTEQYGETYELGPYIPPEEVEAGLVAVGLEDEPEVFLKFPTWFRRWFASQTKSTLVLLNRLIKWLSPYKPEQVEERLRVLDEMIDREISRRALRKTWRRTLALGLTIVPTVWLAVIYVGDKIAKTIENWPAVLGVWKLIMGSV